MGAHSLLSGERHVLLPEDPGFPEALRHIPEPPKRLHVIGDVSALREGLAIVGARKATPYGLSSAAHFAGLAAEAGIVVISGGARGCDAASHRAAVACEAPTVVFLGGGCDDIYPAENKGLFQQVIDCGGAVVSEEDWTMPPIAYMFRRRNRLIAGLAKATLIVEAGLPSGTFSTADEALAADKEVLVVPGAITSKHSRGANRLIYQGATPIVDDETFHDQVFAIFGALTSVGSEGKRDSSRDDKAAEGILDALGAQQLTVDELLGIAHASVKGSDPAKWLMMWLASAQRDGIIAKFPNGRYGAIVQHKM